MHYYGTLGPACADEVLLKEMFMAGMTGLRLNMSHMKLSDCMDWLFKADRAAKSCGKYDWELLIDLQGPELRIGKLDTPLSLIEGETVTLSDQGGDIPVQTFIMGFFEVGQEVLLDDGKICLKLVAKDEHMVTGEVMVGGKLTSSKSIALFADGMNLEIPSPALTEMDLLNLSFAGGELLNHGIRLGGIMQPFVRSAADLKTVRESLDERGLSFVKIFAKIENMSGASNLESLLPYADEIIIARGDLGNAVGLTALAVAQKRIEKICKEHGMPYMVVTQMLNSMMEHPVPTRAEVSDIAHAVYHGAGSVMLTGETAAGKYPLEAIRYLVNTSEEMLSYMKEEEQ